MKTFFIVKQAGEYETWSGRFDIVNDNLDISNKEFDLMKAIDGFLSTFKKEYYYWYNINDNDLNKEALTRKKKFMEHKNMIDWKENI